MKKKKVFMAAVVCALVLAGCGADKGTQGQDGDALVSAGGEQGDMGQEEDSETLWLRIVDGSEEGDLVLAGEGRGDVYTLFVQGGDIPIYLDGQPADASSLEDGMMVEVRYGYVMETFPGQMGQVDGVWAYSLGTEQNPAGGYYDLCGLYLQVLNDLWDRDEGLNGGVNYVSVDLSAAPGGLTEGEKGAVAWIFACSHNAEWLSLPYGELKEQGYLTEAGGAGNSELYQWEDGILFTISAHEEEEEVFSLPQLSFDAQKWRSPLGAYYFMDCNAVWPESGTWSGYEIGGEAIS